MMSSRPILQQLQLAPERDGHLWRHHGKGSGIFHRHEELEVNLCLSGHAHYLVGERKFRLARRSLLWLFPSQNHFLLETSPDFEMWICVWKPRLLEASCRQSASAQLKQSAPEKTWIRRLRGEDAARLEALFEAVSAHANSDHFNAGLGYALMECHAAHQCADEAIGGRAVHPCVESAARILRDEAPTLPELSRRVGLSPARLSRLFGAQIGVSVSGFRAKMALERFAKLYDGRNLSLTDAAIEAGFGSYAQFHRVFLAHHGCTPAQHRARLREGNDAI